jgi:TATA-box binding protein (TBP) (component of TFIID and TFIIIB)
MGRKPAGLKCEVTNRVAVCRVGNSIDWVNIALAHNLHFDPSKFPSVRAPFRNPTFTTQIFQKGKLVMVGVKNEWEALTCFYEYLRTVNSALGTNLVLEDFQFHNEVYRVDLGRAIHLEKFHEKYAHEIDGDVQVYHGLSWKIETVEKHGQAITIVVYAGGKLVMCGAKTKEQRERGLVRVKELEQFLVKSDRQNAELRKMMKKEFEPWSKPVEEEEEKEPSASKRRKKSDQP